MTHILHVSLVTLAVAAVRAYQVLLSPIAGGTCRFHPTCSQYAVDALITHGFLQGGWLALRRFGRCHPLGSAGWDPVPPAAAALDRVWGGSASRAEDSSGN
ncbi:MAG: membrane protein insertion efficiency factor YidD [Luteitalea sp.]|nr:membrane protein insertion efficiency factor YidD [Luteitalea sp.]